MGNTITTATSSSKQEEDTTKEKILLECDYLIVGAGATPLAFLDTLLLELPQAKVILIDKKNIPGGHWVDAYGYVRLHQPSVVYGLESRQLEGNWLKCILTNFALPWAYRSTKTEILEYFGSFVNDKVASKQVEFYPNCVYDFKEASNLKSTSNTKDDGIHRFSSVDGTVSYKVKVRSKLVDGTRGECIIPHDTPPQFPVDEGICILTPNQIYDAIEANDASILHKDKQFVVLGAGKTGMDCIVYLQSVMNIDPSKIAWIISQDVWMLKSSPWIWPQYVAKHAGDKLQAALELEEKGAFTRLDESITPSTFRYPVVQSHHLQLLRKVKTVIRRGRATAIRCSKQGVATTIEFGSDHAPWQVPFEDCVFIHATSPGPFNFKDTSEPIFASSQKMTLDYLFAPPISFNNSCLAKLEAARVKKTLDVNVMKELVVAYLGEEISESVNAMTTDDMLRILIKRVDIMGFVCQANITEGILFAILDKDPLVSIRWMKSSRVSLLSVPLSKSGVCDKVRTLLANATALGLAENDVRMLKIVSEKIKPLEGM